MVAKFGIIFGVIAVAIVLSLQVLGVLETSETYQVLSKVLGVIAIISIAGGAIAMIAGRSQGPSAKAESQTPPTGPQF